MMTEIDKYMEKYNIDYDGKVEMLEILNKSLIMISKGILETTEVKVPDKKVNNKVKEEVNEERKRYKSRKAEEYAEEHNLTLEDFTIEEVSKKDVENKVREVAKRTKETKIESKITKESTKVITKESTKESTKENKISEIKKSKEKVICSGINKKGESCKSVGTIQPNGAKKRYCFRHAEDFTSFECDSDSSDDEETEEELKEELKEEELIDGKVTKKEEPNKELKEEELEEEELEEEELEEEELKEEKELE